MPDYRKIARNKALKYGINPTYFVRQIGAESNFDPRAGSPAGAQGIAQIMPTTAQGWGVDPWKPVAALDAAAKNMARYVKQYGSYRDALVAYNAGPGRVGKPLFTETANYVHKILGPGPGPKSSQATRAASSRASSASGGKEATDPGFDLTSGRRFSPEVKATLAMVFRDNPRMLQIFENADRKLSVTPRPGDLLVRQRGGKTVGVDTVVKGGKGAKVPLANYKDILRLANRLAGAKIQGDFQTIAGNHDPGGYHPKHRAADFGDANTSPAQFRKIARYARQHPEQFKELYFNKLGWGIKNGKIIKGLTVEGHDDHMHLAV